MNNARYTIRNANIDLHIFWDNRNTIGTVWYSLKKKNIWTPVRATSSCASMNDIALSNIPWQFERWLHEQNMYTAHVLWPSTSREPNFSGVQLGLSTLPWETEFALKVVAPLMMSYPNPLHTDKIQKEPWSSRLRIPWLFTNLIGWFIAIVVQDSKDSLAAVQRSSVIIFLGSFTKYSCAWSQRWHEVTWGWSGFYTPEGWPEI